MKKPLLLMLCYLLLTTVQAGVYRHDVDEKKYKDLAMQPQFDCVGQVVNNFSIAGSCVLIGDRYVLCAAHVFITTDPAKPDTNYVNGKMIILNKVANPRVADVKNYMFRFKKKWRFGKSLVIHPYYLDSIQRGNCDLALIELVEPIEEITPATLNTAFDELHSVATGAGWGASGRANQPEEVLVWFEKIAGQNMIDSIGGYKYEGMPTELMADFDAPGDHKDCNKYGSAEPLPMEYMTAGGDSGGGLFRQRKDKTWELIGICTGGGVNFEQLIRTGYYGQLGAWTRVSVFNTWITKTIKEIAQRNKS